MKRRESGIIRAALVFMAVLPALLVIISCTGDHVAPKATPEPPPEPPVVSKPASFISPVRITDAGPGTLAVTDSSEGEVIFINSGTLEKVGRFSVPGRPLGVAVVSNTVFVGIPERVEFGRTKGGNVNAYSKKGKYLYTLGSALGYGLVKDPTDIAVDEVADRIFVLDASDDKVKVYNLAGVKQDQFPGFVMAEQNIAMPAGIALDQITQEVYVSDFGGDVGGMGFGSLTSQVQVYSYSGSWIRTITSSQPGYEFSSPQGMAVSSSGDLYMADVRLGSILIFNSAGDGVGTVGSMGTGPGELFVPIDVLLDEAGGDLFVTSNRNRRIEVFMGAMR